MDENFKDRVVEIIKETTGFTAFNTTDTPTDNLNMVNRRYVTLNGPSTARPTASVVGQFYFDTTLAAGVGKPTWWNGTGFVDAAGNYV